MDKRVGRFIESDGSEEEVMAGDHLTGFPTTPGVRIGDGEYTFWPQENGDIRLYPEGQDGPWETRKYIGPTREQIPPEGIDLELEDVDDDYNTIWTPVTYIPD